MKIFIIKNLKNISLFCLIAVMVVIFMFSAQSAQQSSELSGKIVELVIKVVIPDYDNLSFIKKQEITEHVNYIIRKTAHFSEFAALGFFLTMYLFLRYINVKLVSLSVFSWLLASFYAVTDEIHQMFVTDRYSSVFDVLIDSSGVVFGIIVFILFLKFYLSKYLFLQK